VAQKKVSCWHSTTAYFFLSHPVHVSHAYKIAKITVFDPVICKTPELIFHSLINFTFLHICRLNCIEMSRHIICSGIWRQQRQWECTLSLPQSTIRRSLRSLSPDAVETPHQHASRSRRLRSDRSVSVTMCRLSKNIVLSLYVMLLTTYDSLQISVSLYRWQPLL